MRNAVLVSFLTSMSLIQLGSSLRGQELSPPLIVPEAGVPSPSPFSDQVSEALAPPNLSLPTQTSGALNNLFSHQWVQTDGTGALRGTVVTLAGEDTLSVSGTKVILAQRGRVMATTSSNSEGAFFFGNVPPGYYSIIAEADNSFATFGLAVLNKESGSHLPTALEIRVVRPKGESIRRALDVDVLPNVLSGTSDGVVRDPIALKRVYAKSHRILSTDDGKVVGRLSTMGMAPELVDMSQTKAMLLKDGVEIATSSVSMAGEFAFENVAPGCYGLVATGNRGVAAVAFCVIKPQGVAMQKTSDGKVLVAMLSPEDDASSSLNVELADAADVVTVEDVNTTEDEVVEAVEETAALPIPPVGGNMFGAGQVIGGGGSGSGLGAGFGDILGLGALAAIAYVIANDDDDDQNNNVVSPVVQ